VEWGLLKHKKKIRPRILLVFNLRNTRATKMSIKREIKKLAEEVESLKEHIKNLTIDTDDPNYAIYIKSDCGQIYEYFDINMHKKKPINKTAIQHELERLYTIKRDEFDKKAQHPTRNYHIPEYDMLWSMSPVEKKADKCT